MSKFRLTKNVPDVYVNQSRDFQLLLRLYDSIFSGVKFDIDSCIGIISTHKARNSILSLLATKLGFFTDLEITDNKLRTVLEGFPIIVRNKGSLLAIKQTMNLYLKTEHIKCNIIITFNSDTTMIGGVTVLDHTVSIGSDKTLRNPEIIMEIFRYILPIGFRVRFYSFRSLETEMIELENNDDVVILYKVSTVPFSSIRHMDIEYPDNVTDGVHIPSINPDPDYTDPTDPDNIKVINAQNEMLGSVGIMELTSANDISNSEQEDET